MKAHKMKLTLFLSILLIYQINSLSFTYHVIIHEDSEFEKVCTLDDQNVLILSSVRGQQKTKESKLDKKGKVIYGNSTLEIGYTGSAQLVQPHAVNGVQPNYLLSYHNKQSLPGHLSKENTIDFKQGVISRNIQRKDSLYKQKSSVALKNGKVILAGIMNPSGFGAVTVAEVNLFDPIANKNGEGISFESPYSQYISCYEQKLNNVYCVYVSYEHEFVSILSIKHIVVDNMKLIDKGSKPIKAFYTVFNFLKAIPFDENEGIILFQIGNNKNIPRYGNSGKDLYYYHLTVSGDDVSVKRYEYLYDGCVYREDAEDYNADIAVLSPKRIYAACETDIGRFRGFIIYPDKSEIDEFNFNNFDAESVRNPVFAKFDKSLGIFYTHITVNENARVAYHLMNYPDCFDYRDKTFLLPKHFVKDDFDFSGKVFMNNPYPASRANEKINVRFENYGNISIINTNENKNIVVGKDYDPNINLKIRAEGIEGIYAVEYTATREDDLDGLIIGKTCKINFNTPKCLDRCYSCTRTGNSAHHYCLGCAAGPYYEEEDNPIPVNEGYGIPHNCPNCNISCSSCYGPFLSKPPTTNCKECDYENGYYHYFDDERTCISTETKKYWEGVIGHAIYLDKTPEGNKKLWRWRFCHDNCASCSGPGDDIDNQCDTCKEDLGLHFYCNQTIGHGIPGSCHPDCENNGFFLRESENMKKCCPCLDGCQICKNETECIHCWNPLYLMPNHDKCVNDCPYCLAKDNQLWECVNCKTRYAKEKYHLNGTCYDEIPLIEYEDPDVKGKPHHVIDEQCNLLKGCKEGCFDCKGWYTEKCIQCSPNFYKKDFFGLQQPPYFPCYKEKECQGIEPYQFNPKDRIGGVPKKVNNELVCYNCKLRENNYRQVENNFVCGPRAKRTYIDIPEYNKLSQCYLRCASCDDWGNSCFHNCTSCRDSSTYGLELYNPPFGKYGNCIRYSHKCKDLPYYHNYDLAEELGLDEDNCGQDCDVCLENRTCTENFPYFVVATRECVELCPLTDVLSQTCLMNHTNAGFILLRNPFELQNTFNFINETVNISQVISSNIFQKFAADYNIDVNAVSNEINNNLGKGQIFNLPKSEIIIGNNISIELTSVKLELEKLKEKLFGDSTTTTTATTATSENTAQTSILDISECSEILKKKYGLPEEEDLMIIKGDTLKELSNYFENQVDYQIFSYSLGAFLPLSDCKEQNVQTTVINPFSPILLSSQFQMKTDAVISNGYDAFDSESPFYNDVCTPFTNENGNDVLLDERRTDYFSETLNICEKGCTFKEYNASTNLYSCSCPVKDTINPNTDNIEIVTKELPESFYKKHKNSNIEVFKCSSQVFSKEGQKKNIGSYILIACFVSFIGIVVFYIIKGTSKIDFIFNNLINNNIPANPPKQGVEVPDNNAKSSSEPSKSQKFEGQPDLKMTEEDLNSANYEIAKKNDKRGYFRIYWSLLKLKQLIIFTFYTSTDHNLRIAKIALFILFVSFYFAFTALFFNDSIMRSIYIYKGNTDAAVHIPNIILSSLCCLIMNFIVRFVSLSERDISKINCENNEEVKNKLIVRTKKILKIKLIVFFAISGALIILCWYYVAAFCAVFKNSQGHYLINVLVAFIVCNIWPCVTSLIPPILRRYGLDKNSPCMYKASQIISYI